MFAIGDREWTGVSKLVEEAGEVVQVLGKLIGSRGIEEHWDGSNLRQRLHEELADLLAAIEFVIERNALSRTFIEARKEHKLNTFRDWHERGL